MKPTSSATVTCRFREIAARFCRRPAVHDGKITTYEELDNRSDQIAAHLIRITPETPSVIGLSLTSPAEMLAAMLAVMKIGFAYTIIDPGTHPKRKQAIAEEIGLELVLGDQTSEPWPAFSGQWIDAGVISDELFRDRLFRSVSSEARCCIVQTSGTTGKPLGVEISHAALLHTIENYSAMATIVPEDRFTMLTSASFFAAQTAIFGALLNGACICPFDVKTRGLAAMTDWLEGEGLTIYQSPPSLFRTFVRQIPKGRSFPALRFLRLGGEPVLVSDFELFKTHFPARAQFVNALGVSEAGGNVAYLRVERDLAFEGPLLPVGAPSPGQEIFLADETGQAVAPGEVGEIVVRSQFLATGYYRRPDLTARKFRTFDADGRRELWTGDLGHLTPEGWLMHDGRKDDQVKILGHRVDIAGLESIIHSIPDVHEARVLARRNEGRADELFAFVVPASPGITAASVRIKLSELITAPVIPRVIVIERLPLNSGGKIDRARLLQLAAEGKTLPYSSRPRNKTERELAKIWNSVLGLADIGVYDNFFAAGGDSLAALSASAAIEKRFNLVLPPGLFLDRPSIAQMGEYISARRNSRPFHRLLGLRVRERAEQIVALREPEGKAEAPLFICPGGWGHEGELLVFASMLKHLPPDLPVYGLKQNFLGNSVPVTEAIGTMARNYLAGIRQIQSRGPYRLLGECIASVIALELAYQLELEGDAAETVILLEPRLPKSEQPETGNESENSSDKIRRYYQVLMEAALHPCRQRVHVIGTEDVEHMNLRLQGWNIFDAAQLEIIRVPGDHASYLREHGGELAREISRAISTTNSLSRTHSLGSAG